MGGMGVVLILEPQTELRELFTRVASRLGHRAVTTIGPEAPEPPVDVILLEPDGAPGLAAARALHAHFPEIPVVCASTLPPTTELRRELSPVAYLTKPFPLRALEHALANAFARSSNGA
jgi:CheY-like chemotaxis protein